MKSFFVCVLIQHSTLCWIDLFIFILVTVLRASNYPCFLESRTIACKCTNWHAHRIGWQLLEFLTVQNPEFLLKSSSGFQSVSFYWLQAKYKERWETPDTRGTCRMANTQDAALFSFNVQIIHYACRWISFSMNTAYPFTRGWRGWPSNTAAMIYALSLYQDDSRCSNMLFSTYEKWYCIKANAELQSDFPSLPKPVCVICKSNNNKDSKVYYSASLDFPVSFCAPYRYSSELRAEAT